jgi:hypothetical protein
MSLNSDDSSQADSNLNPLNHFWKEVQEKIIGQWYDTELLPTCRRQFG